MHLFQYLLRRRAPEHAAQLARKSRKSIGYRLKLLMLQLFLVLAAHVLLIAWAEKLSFGDAVWLTLTTVTTVGYGDISAATPLGQILTIVLLYFMGIWMLAQLAGEYLDYRVDRKDRIIKGLWDWNDMKDHIVIVNAPENNTSVYLNRLVGQFRATPTLADKPIILVATIFPEGLPKSLSDQGVVYKSANTSIGDFFESVNMAEASYIVFLAQDDDDPRSDSVTLDLLDQYQRTSSNRLVVAEAVQDSNYERFRKLGADSILRPVRAYPELIVRAMAAPGTEKILEDLFGYFGAAIHRYDIDLVNKDWKRVACGLVENNLGMALGYIDKQGDVKTCPSDDQPVNATALLVMARDECLPTQSALETCLLSV